MKLKQLPEYFRTIGYDRPWKVIALFSVSFLITLTELASIVLIFPIIQAFLDYDAFSQGRFANILSHFLQFDDKQSVAVLLIGTLSSIIIFRSLLSYFGYRWIFRMITADEAAFTTQQYQKIINRDYLFFQNEQSSKIIRDLGNAIPKGFSNILQASLIMFSECLVFIGLSVYLLILNPVFFALVLAMLIVAALIYMRLIGPKLTWLGQQKHELTHKGIGVVSQSLEGVSDIKNWRSEGFFANLFFLNRSKQARVLASQMAMQNIPRLYFESLIMLSICAGLLYFIVSGANVNQYLPLIGFYVVAAFRSLPSILRVSMQYNILSTSKPGIETVLAFGRDETQVCIPKKEPLHMEKMFEVKDISFSYDGQNNILDDLSFNFQSGEMIGIAGRSGEGKTTLINIMTGLLVPQEGGIIIDGHILSKENHDRLLSTVAYVPQNTFLLPNTLRANVAFGVDDSDINDDKVRESLQAAQLEDFVQELEGGLYHYVGERGALLSGGQRQRIGIARAFYFDRDIIIFDEATSALDHQTEKALISVLQSLKKKKTILVISHRPDPLSVCDRIYDIENGKLHMRQEETAA